MVTINEVKQFIESPEYDTLLYDIQKRAKVEINSSEPNSTILNFDVIKLNAAGISTEVLKDLFEEKDKVVNYVINKLVKYNNIDLQQDYPDGEEPDEPDRVIKKMPFYKDFLVIYLIEFYFLKEKKSGLSTYLKAIKIPKAKVYENEITELYNKLG